HDRQGRAAEAMRDFDNALELAREAGNRQLECVLLGNRGAHLAEAGRDAEAMTWQDKALRLAGEVGDAEGAGIAAADLATVYGKLTARRLARHETSMPAGAANQSEAALAADPAGSEAPKEWSDEDRPAESHAFDAMSKAIQRVVFAFLRQTPEGIEPETWAKRLAEVTAAFTVGGMVEDPAPVMRVVGDDQLLRHVLGEILDCFTFEKIDLAPAYRLALETQLAMPFNEADCDRTVRDLITRVERGLRRRDAPFEALQD